MRGQQGGTHRLCEARGAQALGRGGPPFDKKIRPTSFFLDLTLDSLTVALPSCDMGDADDAGELCAYELERLENIRKNKEVLRELGLEEKVPEPTQTAPKAKPQQKSEPTEPTRRCPRLAGRDVGEAQQSTAVAQAARPKRKRSAGFVRMPPPPFSPNDLVQLHGLQRDVESNGRLATIIRRRNSNGKWLCRMRDDDTHLSVKEKNLKRVTHAQSRARTAQQPRAAGASLLVPANTALTSRGNDVHDATDTRQPCPRCNHMYALKAGGVMRKHLCRMRCPTCSTVQPVLDDGRCGNCQEPIILEGWRCSECVIGATGCPLTQDGKCAYCVYPGAFFNF
jgi:hypothetical protein